MKRILLAGIAAFASSAALAADLPRTVAPPPVFTPVPVFTWTGFYAGTHSNYAFGDRDRITTFGNNDGTGGVSNTIGNVASGRRAAAVSNKTEGFGNIGGGFGYNYQFTPGSGFVVGVAFDWNWTDINKRTAYFGPPLAANGFTTDPSVYQRSLDWLGTVHGKVGYAFDRVMVYGLGGFAYGQVFYDAQFLTPGFALAYAGRHDSLETGFSYGGGIEYAIPADNFLSRLNFASLLGIQTSAVTLKAEYVRYDLGSRNVLVNSGFVPTATGSYTSRFSTEGSLVRAGFNYKFGSN